MRILIIKMSSMGDLLHTLPAVSDARTAIPNIRFDWVAEEAFTEIPRWHPQVDHVIPIGLRRWRRQSTWNASCKEIRDFIKNLRHRHYDGMIDAQGSIKSAIVTRLAHGPRYGMDKRSVREVGAQWAYQKKCFIHKAQHAILRIRQLFAQALGYPLPDTEPQYGIDPNQLPICPIALPEQYLILIPNASREDKCWPEENWSTLINAYTGAWPLLIPWGNANEKARAVRLSALDSRVIVLPKLRLGELARIWLNARCIVGVDTGLSHLAAALGIPAITLYGKTNPQQIGTLGQNQQHISFVSSPNRIQTKESSLYQVAQALQTVLND